MEEVNRRIEEFLDSYPARQRKALRAAIPLLYRMAQKKNWLQRHALYDVLDEHYDDLLEQAIERMLKSDLTHLDLSGDPKELARSLLSYVRKAIERLAANHVRDSKRRKNYEESFAVLQPKHINWIAAIELRIDLQRLLAQLPKQHAALLYHWAVEEFSVRELAKMYSVSKSTLNRWIVKARQLLRTLFGKEEPIEEDRQLILELRFICKEIEVKEAQ